MWAVGIAAAPGCDAARAHYEALAFDEALVALDNAPPASGCFEVEALVKLALGRRAEAAVAFRSLFERDPDYRIDTRALAPGDRKFIATIRSELEPVSVEVKVDWRQRTALRVQMALQGGLRGAARIRFEAAVGPTVAGGVVPLVGGVATTTLSIGADAVADRMMLRVRAQTANGRTVHEYEVRRLLPPRPPLASSGASSADEGGWPWWVWTLGAVVVVGAAVTTVVLVQPESPDATGTAGGIEIP